MFIIRSICINLKLLLVWCVSISTAQLDYSPCSYKNNNQVECFDVNASQVLEAFFRNGNNSHIKTIEMQYVQDLNADILQVILTNDLIWLIHDWNLMNYRKSLMLLHLLQLKMYSAFTYWETNLEEFRNLSASSPICGASAFFPVSSSKSFRPDRWFFHPPVFKESLFTTLS